MSYIPGMPKKYLTIGLLLTIFLTVYTPNWAKPHNSSGEVLQKEHATLSSGGAQESVPITKKQYAERIIKGFPELSRRIELSPGKRRKLLILCLIANETPHYIFSSEDIACLFDANTTAENIAAVQSYLKEIGIKGRAVRRSNYKKVRQNVLQIRAQCLSLRKELTVLQLPGTAKFYLEDLWTPEARSWQDKIAAFGIVAEKIAQLKGIMGSEYRSSKKWQRYLQLLETLAYMSAYSECYSSTLLATSPRTAKRDLRKMGILKGARYKLEEILESPSERVRLQERINKFLDKAIDDATSKMYLKKWGKHLKKQKKRATKSSPEHQGIKK